MRNRLLQLAALGLVGLLIVVALPGASLAQTETPTTMPTATPLATVTRRPTNTPRPTATRTPAPAATPTVTVQPTPAVEATATPAALPITGNHGTLNAVTGLAPIMALLLLAIPALTGLRARLK